MGRLGCNINGNLNDAKFSEPLPWIGVYIASASLLCLMAMGLDIIHGLRQRKLWFPCKFFSLNSASLTLISIAIKLPVDLNTSMPSKQDQLAKLSSTVLMCTIMGNTMPSFGTMENKEIFANIISLGILVITLIVNVCIQLGTGVIYVFWKEYALIMFLLLVLLVVISFSALTVPTTKKFLEIKYNKKFQLGLKEGTDGNCRVGYDKIKADLMKYWMMAHTCSPQFVVGRSVTCTASGAICLVSAATLAEAIFKSYFMPCSFNFCSGESDYKWSTTSVLVIQTVAVGVGTIAPAFRWFIAINFRCLKRGKESYKREFRLERYWIQRLIEIKECPLSLRIHNRSFRRIAHNAKDQMVDFCIKMQAGIVLLSKLIRLVSILCASRILLCCDYCRELKKFCLRNNVSNYNLEKEMEPDSNIDLFRFVLHLEGEDELAQVMIKQHCGKTDHWIEEGRKRQPMHLIKLLEEVSNISKRFKGVGEFDSDQVSSLDGEEPPNCWALPVVTLTSIAISLPKTENSRIEQLVYGVHEGLKYVNLIEEHLDTTGELSNIRNTANVVWKGVDLYHKWLDVDLYKLSLGKSPKEVLEELVDTAKKKDMQLKKIYKHACLREIPSNWPVKVLAVNSMYRISQTILMKYENRYDQLGDALVFMISDILCACFTNLQRVIYTKCLKSAIEEKEDSVRHAVSILGKTEKILKLLEQMELPSLDPDKMGCIDEWRTVCNPKDLEGNTVSSDSREFYLSID